MGQSGQAATDPIADVCIVASSTENQSLIRIEATGVAENSAFLEPVTWDMKIRRNPFQRWATWLAMLALAVALSGCDFGDRPPAYRYRLTVEVDTPDGLRTGSSVIQVRQRLVHPGSNPTGVGVVRTLMGEAVAVDLPNGRTMFALLCSNDDMQWAASVMQLLAPSRPDENFRQQLNNVLELKGPIVLPKRFPSIGPREGLLAYPMLVTFRDQADPTSIVLLDPDDVSAALGHGVSVRRITAELTSDPVTTGIERRLKWLPYYYNKQLSGDTYQMLDNIDKGLSAFIGSGAFSAGTGVKEMGNGK